MSVGEVFKYISENGRSGIIKLHAIKMAWDREPPEPPSLSGSKGAMAARAEEIASLYTPVHDAVSSLFGNTIAFLEKVDENFKLEDTSQAEILAKYGAGLVQTQMLNDDITASFLSSKTSWDSFWDTMGIAMASDWIQDILSTFSGIENTTEETVRKNIESLIDRIVKGNNRLGEQLETFTDPFTSEELKNAKKYIKTLLLGGKTYSKETMDSFDVRTITESDFSKFVSQSENLAYFTDLKDQIDKIVGPVSDAVDVYDTVAEVISISLADYSENIRYLEALKRALVDAGYDNKTVNEAIDKLLSQYNDKAKKALDGIQDKIVEILSKEGVKALSEVSPLELFLQVKDASVSATGLKEQADNTMTVYTTSQYSYPVINKYNSYVQKILSGDYTDEDRENYLTYFELARNAKIQEYEAIRDMLEDAMNGIGSWFKSDDDIQAVKLQIQRCEVEIRNLKNMKPLV